MSTHSEKQTVTNNDLHPSVTLSSEQFERLYLQPRGNAPDKHLSKYFANPTALGVITFSLSVTVIAGYLLGFQGASADSMPVTFGMFFFSSGLGLTLAGIFEFIIGNTFPFLVFSVVSGFFYSWGALNQPSQAVSGAFTASGGAMSVAFTSGVGWYLILWGLIHLVFAMGALRTNVAFVWILTWITAAYFTIGAAYFAMGNGSTNVSTLLTAGGALAFIGAMGGWYLFIAMVLDSVGFPFTLPNPDLSSRVFAGKAKSMSPA
ncbi:hypothetical protein CBS101457_005082 [Exobasidium rhododendri]|nr:hypothetical protein CBS101457_005082 [Exobasidium rhododendri]